MAVDLDLISEDRQRQISDDAVGDLDRELAAEAAAAIALQPQPVIVVGAADAPLLTTGPTTPDAERVLPAEDRAALLEAIVLGTEKGVLAEKFPQSTAERKAAGGFQIFKSLVDDYATALLSRVTYDPKTSKIGNIGGVKKKINFLYAWLNNDPQKTKVKKLISDAIQRAKNAAKPPPDAQPQIVTSVPTIDSAAAPSGPEPSATPAAADLPLSATQPLGEESAGAMLEALFRAAREAQGIGGAPPSNLDTSPPPDADKTLESVPEEHGETPATTPPPATVSETPGWITRNFGNKSALAKLARALGLGAEVTDTAAVTSEAARAQAAAPEAAEARAQRVAELLAKRIQDVEQRTAKRGWGIETARKLYNALGEMNLEKIFGKQTGAKGYLLRFASVRTALSVGLMGVGALSEAGAMAWIASQAARKSISMVGAYNLARNFSESGEYLQKLQGLDEGQINALQVHEIVQQLATIELRTLAGTVQADELALHNRLLSALEQRIREQGVGKPEERISAAMEGILKEVDKQRTSYTRGRVRDAALSAAYAFLVAPEIGKGLRWLMGHGATPPAGGAAAEPSPRASAVATPHPPSPSAAASPEAPPRPIIKVNVFTDPVETSRAAPGDATVRSEALLPRPSPAGAAAATQDVASLPVPRAEDVLTAAGAKAEGAGKFLVEFGKGKIAADSDSALRYIALAEMKLDNKEMLDAMEVAKLLNIRDNLKLLLEGHSVSGVGTMNLHGVLEKVPGGWKIVNEEKLGQTVHRLLVHANQIEDRLKDGGALAWADRLPKGEMAKMQEMIEHRAQTPIEPNKDFAAIESKNPPFTPADKELITHAKEQVLTHQLHEEGVTVKDVHVLPDGSAQFTAVDEATKVQEKLTIPNWGMEPGKVSETLAANDWVDADDTDDVSTVGAPAGGAPAAAGAVAGAEGTPAAEAPVAVENLKYPPVGPSIKASEYLEALKGRSAEDQFAYFKKLLKPLGEKTTRAITMPGGRTAFLYQFEGKMYLFSPNLGIARQALDANNVSRWLARILRGS